MGWLHNECKAPQYSQSKCCTFVIPWLHVLCMVHQGNRSRVAFNSTDAQLWCHAVGECANPAAASADAAEGAALAAGTDSPEQLRLLRTTCCECPTILCDP